MADLKYGYSINQWTYAPSEENFIERRGKQERVFKVLSECKFRAVELDEGSGRWSPLGRREQIVINFGSVKNFRSFLQSCGIDRVASWFYDPARPSGEEAWGGGSPLVASDHEGIVNSARPFAVTLSELGGSCLVVRPTPSYWRVAPVTEEKLRIAADCWNRVGEMTLKYGIQTVVHTDFLSAIRSPEHLDRFLSATDPRLVGLDIDTADTTIAGNDPLELYEKYRSRVKHFHFKDTHAKDSLEEYKEPNAEYHLLSAGGKRGIERWYWEMGTPTGLVDFPRLVKALKADNFAGWIIVASDESPDQAESVLLNAYYVQRVLARV